MSGKYRVLCWDRIEGDHPGAGIYRQFVCGERMMVGRMTLDKGLRIPVHSHANEQISVILEGRLEVTLGQETRQVEAGMTLIIPPDVPHGALIVERAIILDVFNPPRQDWLDETDDYLRVARSSP